MKNLELKKKFKNKYMIRVAAGAVTIAVLGSSAGMAYTVQAQKTEGDAQESNKNSKAGKREIKETLEKVLSASKENEEAGKEETVYVVADANGKAKDVIVSEWLKNKDGKDTLEDESDLKDIKNVKGEESFTQNGDKITWQADGKDIYYQGTTDKELPIDQKVTYFLDGKEMSPQEIAGKSGKVTIRFDYENRQKSVQMVEGEEHEVYVPFTVMTGMILPEDYSNVEVTNGKVISDGNRKVAVGMAMPGLKESLEIEEEDLDGELKIPDYVEVTADVENFSLEMTMTIAMNDLLGSSDLSQAFDLTGLEDDMNTLTDASEQLVSGSKELSEGLDTLKSSMKEFASGVDTLKSGISSYTDGAAQLNDGIRTLSGSSGTLVNGVTTLNNSAATLNNGVAQLDQTLKAEMTPEERADLLKQADDAIDGTFRDKKQGTEAIRKQASAVFYDSLANNQGAKDQVSAGLEAYTRGMLGTVLGQAFSQTAETVNGLMPVMKEAMMAKGELAVRKAASPQVAAQAAQQTSDAMSQNLAGKIQQISAGIAQAAQQTAEAKVQAGGEAVLTPEEVQSICAGVIASVSQEELKQEISGAISQYQNGVDQAVEGVVAGKMPEIEQQIKGEMSKYTAGMDANTLASQTVEVAMNNASLRAGMDSVASQIVTGIADGAKDTVGAAVADTAKTAAKTAAESATLSAVDGTKAKISSAINATDQNSGYSLVTGMQALSQGTQAMNDSMPALTGGISQLANGAAALVSNNEALTGGASKLSGAASLVEEGVTKLDDGSRELMEGMVKFDEEGIRKLTDAYDGDVKVLLNKLEAVVNAGKEYQTFAKAAKETKGSVKFIIRTEAVKAEQKEE